MTTAVSSVQPRGALGRVRNFFSAWLTGWVRDREQENPRAIYEQAIHGRLRRSPHRDRAARDGCGARGQAQRRVARRRDRHAPA
jgi:hypothetical protein